MNVGCGCKFYKKAMKFFLVCGSSSSIIFLSLTKQRYTGCLIKNASTHNFFYLLSDFNEQKKPKIWFFMRYEAGRK
jgi:hypothetical protein